jgi:hypothetical protein
VEIRKRMEEEFFAEAYLRRLQILELVKGVGLARTQPEVILLPGILEDIYERTADWLVKIDADGNEELYDKNTPQVGEGEKLRSLIERMSNNSHALTSYRALVVAGLEEDRSFENVVADIKKKTRTDISSLDLLPQCGPDTILAARVEEGVGSDARLLAFRQGSRWPVMHWPEVKRRRGSALRESDPMSRHLRPALQPPQYSVTTGMVTDVTMKRLQSGSVDSGAHIRRVSTLF